MRRGAVCCASAPIARQRIDLVCLEAFWLQEWEWVLEDCHKRSCWKNSIGMIVPRPYRSDMYVCSKSWRLCLTVLYWLLECNKVPSWIENPEYVALCYSEQVGLWNILCCPVRVGPCDVPSLLPCECGALLSADPLSEQSCTISTRFLISELRQNRRELQGLICDSFL
jgi:hypothetical protein